MRWSVARRTALVLEHLPGGTLADRIRYGPIAIADVLTTGVVIGDVLHHVHRAGYLHRDVKPSNIGYTQSGTPKLLDFGLVRLSSGCRRCRPRPTFMSPSPEIVHGDTPAWRCPGRPRELGRHRGAAVRRVRRISPRPKPMLLPPSQGFDLWALAVTLYEALTGTNPFVALTVAETMSLVRHARSRTPARGARRLPASARDAPRVGVVRRPERTAEECARVRLSPSRRRPEHDS